jgi:phage protein D
MANLTISPTVVKVLQVIKMNVPVTPAEINAHVGDGDYASKHVWYLGKLGFTITKQKDGRQVASYTLIAEPANAEAIRNTVHGAARKAAAPKAAKAPKQKTVKLSTIVAKTSKEFAAKKAVEAAPKKVAAKKSVADIKAANLAKLKAVGAKFKPKNVREFDDVTETFGTSGEVGTSFNIDRDWDSIEGLDLKALGI